MYFTQTRQVTIVYLSLSNRTFYILVKRI